MPKRRTEARCSFCGKSREQVKRLVAGPGVFICDDCVALCNEIISEAPPVPPIVGQGGTWSRGRSRSRGWLGRLFRSEVLQPD